MGIGAVWTPRLILLALGVGIIGGIANLLFRKRPPIPPTV